MQRYGSRHPPSVSLRSTQPNGKTGMTKLTINDLDLRGKRVFIRVDFNVPLKEGIVTDDTRIRETLPTLAPRHCKKVPGWCWRRISAGRKAAPIQNSLCIPSLKSSKNFSASPLPSPRLCWPRRGIEKQGTARRRSSLLENVRFHPEEEKNDEAFSKQLAALCDGLFVCDAFGSAHRAHASVVGITRFVKQAAAGLLMEKELDLYRQSDHQSRAPLRRDSRRRKSQRQNRSRRKL